MKRSVYMTWAKYHAASRYNLANSGILPCQSSDLSLPPGEWPLNGPNTEGYMPLREAVAHRYGVEPAQVVLAQGASLANFLVMGAMLDRGDQVLIEKPTYEPLVSAARYLGAEVVRFGRPFQDAYRFDVDEVRRLLTPRTRLIVLTHPHNPSGVAVPGNDLLQLGLLAAEAGIHVLCDEVYRDILFGADFPAAMVRLNEAFITTNSLTKCYGLGGLRCGWVLTSPGQAEAMRRFNDLLGVAGPMPAEHLALAAFRQLDHLGRRTMAILEPNLATVRSFLEKHREWVEWVMPECSMIVFPRLRRLSDAQPLREAALRRETSIVPGVFFEEAAHFRLGFGIQPNDLRAGLDHLSEALKEVHLA